MSQDGQHTEEETLVEAALRVLNTADPFEKARLGDSVATRWLNGAIVHTYPPSLDLPVPDRPTRLSNVKLVAPGLMPKLGKAGSLQSRIAIVHSLAHTESWAIDLSWDIIARFGKQEAMPREFFTDFVKVAQDEGRHFTLLAARLEELGSYYGALPAHDGLWDSATATSKDLLSRLAVEHCVHESGLYAPCSALSMTKEMTSLAAFWVAILLVLVVLSCATDADTMCSPRWCGGHNISHPFRLQGDTPHCGDRRYTLSCEDDKLILYWKSGKFTVQSINYNNYTIRIVDTDIGFDRGDHSSSLPSHSLTSYNFSSLEPYSLTPYNFRSIESLYKNRFYRPNSYALIPVNYILLYLRCPYAVESCDLYVDDTAATCINGSYAVGSTFYVNVDSRPLWDLRLGDSCRIEWMYPTSWPTAENNHTNNNISCTDIRNMLLYGFELSWPISACKDLSYHVHLDDHYHPQCVPPNYKTGFLGIVACILAIFALGAPLLIIFWLYKWHRRHLSKYDTIIEDFLRNDNNIMPLRYSYKYIKRITEGFKTKLGNGGYGSVFRGQLRGGRLVAVKVLNNAKSNGQEFINEVATIGRIHHVNVVQLIGFCVDGSKRALIYELMANGSLEKYIFSHEASSSLSCEKLYKISLGVARGIEYLHNGCDMKILHFDIKPHNILLDENFNPKVSDFGLARLYPTDNSIVSLTAARGTIGYMAPELFYRNVGTISYKADVYSFGMLLMEMAGRRKNLNALTEHSSHIYFPFWVYDQLSDGKEIAIENDTDGEMKLAKRMMIVALWCIQTKPSDRPSMVKVVEMLEQDESLLLEMPPKPYFYDPNDVPAAEDHVADHNSSRLSSEISVSNSGESVI